jgi:predicted mannosyl-3-phosphoglycerate phosphatase (HAD superfamily)
MAKQFLHRAQVRTVLQKVAGKGMAKDVWRYCRRGKARTNGNVLQVASKDLPRQMPFLAV